MVAIILAILFIAFREYLENKKSSDYWKRWEEQSFEWNGFRLNKDFYEVINGELIEKHE